MKILTDKGLVNFWSNVKSYISKAIFPANQINLAGENKTVQQFHDEVTENVRKNSDEIKKAKSLLDTQDEINKQQEQKNTQFDKGISDATSKATRMEESINTLTEANERHQSQLDSQQAQITSNDSDISNLQDRSTQLEKSIKDITVTGGASTANAVSYDNEQSGLKAVTAQGAIDEVVSCINASFETKENESWIDVKLDLEEKVIEGISADGKKFINLPLVNPTIKEIQEQARRSYLEITFDDETGDINAILGDNSTITDVSTDDDGNIYIEEEIASGSGSKDPDTLATFADVDINNETILFNK